MVDSITICSGHSQVRLYLTPFGYTLIGRTRMYVRLTLAMAFLSVAVHMGTMWTHHGHMRAAQPMNSPTRILVEVTWQSACPIVLNAIYMYDSPEHCGAVGTVP